MTTGPPDQRNAGPVGLSGPDHIGRRADWPSSAGRWASAASSGPQLGDVLGPCPPVQIVQPIAATSPGAWRTRQAVIRRRAEAEDELSGLDRAAAEAARPAQGKIEAERVRLDAAADASRDREQTLRSERAGLSAGRDLT